MYKKSKKAFKNSKKVLPGGVNSPVRAFKSVKCDPIFFKKGKGSKITDLDGNKYIDCVSSWGPLIFGHADKETLKAIVNSSKLGTSYGAPTLLETEMANCNSNLGSDFFFMYTVECLGCFRKSPWLEGDHQI